LHLVGSLGPLLLELRASRGPEKGSTGSDADSLIFSIGRNATNGDDRSRRETGVDEDLSERGNVGLANLEDGTEFLIEESGHRIVVLLKRIDHDFSSDSTCTNAVSV